MIGFDILEKNNKYGQRIRRKLLNMTKFERGNLNGGQAPVQIPVQIQIDPFTKISLFKPDGELTTG